MSLNRSFAVSDSDILQDIKIQNHIDEVGLKLLNANKIDRRIVFVYDKKDKKIKGEPSLTKRQVVVYKEVVNHISDDNEIAAMLSSEICKATEAHSGPLNGIVSSVQVKFAPKKYEIFFDKKSVDLLVKAGYNPLALITFINKSYPQKRSDKISTHNLTSKRLANIYEYIYFQYPYFLANNEYINNDSYQNFLLNSFDNRKKLEMKIYKNSKERIKYE